jgi:hypothetical protein
VANISYATTATNVSSHGPLFLTTYSSTWRERVICAKFAVSASKHPVLMLSISFCNIRNISDVTDAIVDLPTKQNSTVTTTYAKSSIKNKTSPRFLSPWNVSSVTFVIQT